VADQSRSHFVAYLLPTIRRIAARRGAGIENQEDREDAEAEFIARAWEHYVRFIAMGLEPTLGRILTALYKPEPVWTHRPELDVGILSMGNARVRRMAEAVPA